MKDIHQTLKQYWGYDAFRPLQEEVIHSVLAGRDTLALMPTGGGKSIIYQVSGLVMEGTCLVITPLIALMKDQVGNLKERGILGEAIYTGMDLEEIESIINKCIYSQVDFLYLSPERLASENFRIKLKQMKVSLIAVDEAHCISQWGYDFRPSYLRIAEIRDFFPDVPILALTATATPEVVKDIQQQLKFKEEYVLASSFRRSNLSYVIRECEDKMNELVRILSRVKSNAIVYVRRRKSAEEISILLNKQGITADFYHAGCSPLQREFKQNAWKNGEVPVIVATNAFGMGIDKADVRYVIHHDIPDSPEAYFQEAGRAGRDGIRSYAVLLYNRASLKALKERVKKGFPEKSYVKQVYEALFNHYQIGEGGGQGMQMEFDVEKFAIDFDLNQSKINSSIEILEVAGYLEYAPSVSSRSRVKIIVLRDQLYNIELGDSLLDQLMIILMRFYAGIFVQDIRIDEEFIAGELGIDSQKLYQCFLSLSRRKIIRYIPGNLFPSIIFNQPRFPISYVSLSKEAYEDRKRSYAKKIEGMIGYIELCESCRQLYLMDYFGQKEEKACGICDVCLGKKKQKKAERQQIDQAILALLSQKPMELRELVHSIDAPPEVVTQQISLLLDEGDIGYVSNSMLARNEGR